MAFRLVNARTEKLTPKLAEKFRDLTPSPTERQLDPSRVAHLKSKAEQGRLVTFNWSTAKLGSDVYRMNGQHSSTMLTQLNGSFPEGLVVHLDEYEADDAESLAVLFRQFDDRKSARSLSDVSGAYQGLSAVKDVDRHVAKMAVDAIVWWMKYVEGVAPPKGDEVYGLFGREAYHPFIRWAGEVLTIKTPELKRQPIVAAMYETFTKNEVEARAFWAAVARGGEEFNDTAPTTILDNWLKKATENKDLRESLKPGHYYQGCVFVWNAARGGKSIATVKFDTKKGMAKADE